jgi:hypothetical protein
MGMLCLFVRQAAIQTSILFAYHQLTLVLKPQRTNPLPAYARNLAGALVEM